MLRKSLNHLLQFAHNRKLYYLEPIVDAIDTFCYEPEATTKKPPFIRDAVDSKRWMILVVLALLPVVIMAIWNTGVQSIVYSSSDINLTRAFETMQPSLSGYWHFIRSFMHVPQILVEGCRIFLPLLAISYTVGGFWEVLFAIVRKHKIAEGLLVTGILYPLTLPPTIPYWMAAAGISFGIIFGKEVFGGTGMNILNPALVGRAYLFFSFPSNMSGDVWVGRNTSIVKNNLLALKEQYVDSISQASPLHSIGAASSNIKQIHVNAIAQHLLPETQTPTYDLISQHFTQWQQIHNAPAWQDLSISQLNDFLCSPIAEGGLALLPSHLDAAHAMTKVMFHSGKFSLFHLLFGNIPGAIGETSTLACLLGAFFLIITGIASWRTILGCFLGALGTASLLKLGCIYLTFDQGAWAPAKFFLDGTTHWLLGSFAFGSIFMATDPVSSPAMKTSKWIYGCLIGFLTIITRLINPAYPEGMMLAILMGNILSPAIDYYVVRRYRNKKVKVCR